MNCILIAVKCNTVFPSVVKTSLQSFSYLKQGFYSLENMLIIFQPGIVCKKYFVC